MLGAVRHPMPGGQRPSRISRWLAAGSSTRPPGLLRASSARGCPGGCTSSIDVLSHSPEREGNKSPSAYNNSGHNNFLYTVDSHF